MSARIPRILRLPALGFAALSDHGEEPLVSGVQLRLELRPLSREARVAPQGPRAPNDAFRYGITITTKQAEFTRMDAQSAVPLQRQVSFVYLVAFVVKDLLGCELFRDGTSQGRPREE